MQILREKGRVSAGGATVLSEPCRRWARCCVALLAALAVVAPVAALASVEEAYQKFVRTDRTIVSGIVVRQDRKGSVVATTEEVVVLPARDLRFAGVIVPQAREVADLLTIIESNILSRQFGRVTKNLSEAREAVERFEAFLQPITHSGVPKSNPIRQAAEVAIRYYREELSQVEPTVAMLEAAAEVEAVHKELGVGRRRYNAVLLSDLIGLNRKIVEIAGPTPMARKQRAEAEERLDRHLARCGIAMRVKALERLDQGAWTQPVVDLVGVLAEGRDVADRFAGEQAQVVAGLPAILARYRQQVPARAAEIVRLETELEVTQKQYSEAVKKVRTMSEMLTRIRPLIYGPKTAELTGVIDREVAANNATLVEGARLKEAILAARGLFRDAELALAEGAYHQALQLYQQTSNGLQRGQLQAPEMSRRIRAGMFKATASVMWEALRSSEGLAAEDRAALLERAEALLKAERERLAEAGIAPGVFEKSIQRSRNFGRFRAELATVMDAMERSPVSAWVKAVGLRQWLAETGDNVLPEAHEQWRAFVEKHQAALYGRAAQVFFDAPGVFSEDVREAACEAFVRHVLDNGDLDGAAAVLGKALAADLNGEQVSRKLGQLAGEIGDRFRQAGALERGVTALRQAWQLAPGAAARCGVPAIIRALTEQLANQRLAAGRGDEALDLLEQLWRDFPDAGGHQLKVRTVGLRLDRAARLEAEGRHDEAVAQYEEAARLYPGLLGERVAAQEAAKAQAGRIRALWDEGQYAEALDYCLEFKERYPHFVKETGLARRWVHVIARRTEVARATAQQAGRPPSRALIDGVEAVFARYPHLGRQMRIEDKLVDLKLDRAASFLAVREVGKAFDIYRQIQEQSPDLARARSVAQTMRGIAWKYRMEQIEKPLGIEDERDQMAVAVAVLLMLLGVSQAVVRGKSRGHVRYRLMHTAVVSGVFLALLAVLLYGKMRFMDAFAYAYLGPLVVAHGVGAFSYSFFPLVYSERRLSCERVIVFLLDYKLFGMQLSRMGLGGAKRLLLADIARLEQDLPMLHDAWLIRLDRARRLEADHPEAALARYQAVMQHLTKELIKDGAWGGHYNTCLFCLGELSLRVGKEEEGLAHLEEHIRAQPKHVPSRLLVSERMFERGRYADAIPHLKICLAAQGENDQLWYRLGRCFFETGDDRAAHKCLSNIEQPSRDVNFYAARAHARDGQFKPAVRRYQAILNADPDDGEAVYYLASALARFGDLDKAMKLSTMVKPEHPMHARAVALQGVALAEKGKLDSARQRLQDALNADPGSRLARLGLARCAIEEGDQPRALELAEAVLADDATDPAANFYAGFAYQKADPGKALFHLNKVGKDPAFLELAERQLGAIYFFRGEYRQAATHFARTGKKAAGDSLWRFVNAFSLAGAGDADGCQQHLLKLFGTAGDPHWEAIAPKAMFSLAMMLFKKQAFEVASQCLDFVREQLPEPERKAQIEALMAACRFRALPAALAAGRWAELEQLGQTLLAEIKEPERHARCKFYLALAMLRQQQYPQAQHLFTGLARAFPDDSRFVYHQMIAELGSDIDGRSANKTLFRLATMPDVPPRIAAGVTLVKALLKARQGSDSEARKLLAPLVAGADAFPGGEVVRTKARRFETLLLCRAGEYDAVRAIGTGLEGEARNAVEYMLAIGAVEKGNLDTALEHLTAAAPQIPAAAELRVAVCTHLALREVENHRHSRAREIMDSIPNPPPEIEWVRVALTLSEVVQETDDVAAIGRIIEVLENQLEHLRDPRLAHSLVHNLAVYHVRRCLRAEEQPDLAVDRTALWRQAMAFWQQRVFANPHYWGMELERLAAAQETVRPFSQGDLDRLNQSMADTCFRKPLEHLVLQAVQESDEAALERLLGTYREFARQRGQERALTATLSKQVNSFISKMTKDDDRRDTWDFRLVSLLVQVHVARAMGEDVSEREEELELLRRCRAAYASPSEFTQARKRFNTELLSILQDGSMGSFGPAGNRIEKLLKDLTPGLAESDLVDRLHLLRTACRNPAQAANQGFDLPGEFQNLYAKVRGGGKTAKTRARGEVKRGRRNG